jgi:hypothetical protein
MARVTILELTQRLAAANAEIQTLRLDNSILRADVARINARLAEHVDAAINAKQPAEAERLVRISGNLCRVIQERVNGQSVVKRYVPV